MYCPKCAKPSTTDQKFCRHCGFSLKEVAPLVAETPLTAEAEKVRLERHLTKAAGWATLFFVLWILILGSMDIPGLHPTFKKIGGFITLACFGLGIALSLYAGIRWWWLWQFGVSADNRKSESPKLASETQMTELQTGMHEKLLSEAILNQCRASLRARRNC